MIDLNQYYLDLTDEQLLTIAFQEEGPHNDMFVKALAERLACLIGYDPDQPVYLPPLDAGIPPGAI